MTNQKAIEILNDTEADIKYSREDINKAILMGMSALEKQIPKKPIIESWSPARCPLCGSELSELLGDGYYKHWYGLKICECGQKLKWDEM